MRSLALYAVAGVLALSATAAAAPPPLSFGYCINATTSTVYVTLPASTSLVYYTAPSSTADTESPLPTITSVTTVHSTVYLTNPALTVTETISSDSPSANLISETAEPEYTVTIGTTITQTYPSPPASTSSESGPCEFYVDDQSVTHYLNCVAPPTAVSYIIVTSAVTVIPVQSPASTAQEQETSTLTLHSTIHSTIQVTQTSTVSASTPTSGGSGLTDIGSSLPCTTETPVTATSLVPFPTSDGKGLTDIGTSTPCTTSTAVSQGTGLSFTGYPTDGWNVSKANTSPVSAGTGPAYTSPSGGWNGTVTSSGLVHGATGYSASSLALPADPGSLVTSFSSFNIYGTHTSAVSLSTMNAASGFQHPGYTNRHPSNSSTAMATSSAGGDSTTVPTNSSIYSLTQGPQTSPTSYSVTGSAILSLHSSSLSGAPYLNSTSVSSASGSSSDLGVAVSSGAGVSLSKSWSTIFHTTFPRPTVYSSYQPIYSTSVAVSTTSTSSNPSATSIGSGSLSLGDPCSSSSQCADGADCYAVNSMLIPVCGNFQASCTCDEQCAFNTCVEGFCTGVKPQSTLSGYTFTSSIASLNATATAISSINTAPIQASSNAGVSTGSLTVSTPNSTYSVSLPTSSVSSISSGSVPTSSNAGVSNNSSIGSYTTSLSYSVPIPATSTSTSTSQSGTTISSTASPTVSSCGEHGDFTLTFDDIPPLVITNQSNGTIGPEPVFNPYHQFDFSDGFVVIPPPKVPYAPSSKPRMLEFIPNLNVNGTNPRSGPDTAEYGYTGQISNGDHALTGCFSFNVYSASFGCDSIGPNCNYKFEGYQYDPSTQNDTLIATQLSSTLACSSENANCSLTPITLKDGFRNLTNIRITATVELQPKKWYIDDLRLGWFDNSCKTGLCRQNAHIH